MLQSFMLSSKNLFILLSILIGGQRGGVVLFDPEPGKPAEGLGYSHEEVIRNIRKRKKKKTQPPKTDKKPEEPPEPEIMEPEPPVEPEKIEEPGKYKFYTVKAYQQYWRERYYEGLEISQGIDPEGFYEYQGGILQGKVIQEKLRLEYVEPTRKAYAESLTLDESHTIYRTGTGFEIGERMVSPPPSLSGFGSFFLHIGDYAYASLTGEAWTPGQPLESPTMREQRITAYHSDVKAWEAGDVGYYAGAILSNPYTLALTSMGIGATTQALNVSRWGSAGFAGSSLVRRGQAVQSFMGGAGVGYMTGMGTRIEREHGIQSARDYYGKIALNLPVVMGGFQIGQQYGQALAIKLGKLSETFYGLPGVKQVSGQITSFKETGMMAKNIRMPRGIMGEYGLDSGRGNILISDKNINREYITSWEQIRGKRPDPFRNYMATERLGGYESSWELYRSTLNIPKTIYPIKQTYFQPSRTYLIPTKTGIKFISIGGNQQYVSYGNISPLETDFKFSSMGVGKKGGNIYGAGEISGDPNKMFVTGDEAYLHYPTKGSATIYGPKGEATVRLFASPVLRERSFYGLVSSQDIPAYGTSEYSAMFSSGSYRSYSPGTVKFSSEMPFSFGGRVFGESFYTESISFVKQMGGGSQLIRTRIGEGNIFGSKTIELPRIDYTKSFSGIKDGNPFKVYTDTSFTLYPEPPKPKLDFGAGMGDSSYVVKAEPPVGGGPVVDFKQYVPPPSYPSLRGGFSRIGIRTGLSQIEQFESGVYTGSDRWIDIFSGVRPTPPGIDVITPSMSFSEIGKLSAIGSLSGSLELSKSLNVNVNLPKVSNVVDVSRVSDIKTVPDIVSEVKPDVMQSQIQEQQVKQVSGLSLVTVAQTTTVNVPTVTSVQPSPVVEVPSPVFVLDLPTPTPIELLGFDFPGGFQKRGTRRKKKRLDVFSMPLFKIHPIEISRDILEAYY